MELAQAIETRTTVRRFLPEAVPEKDLKEMVRLAGLAPSVNNSQPWRFIAINNAELIQKMSRIVHEKIDHLFAKLSAEKNNLKATVEYFSTIFEKAPTLIAVLKEPYRAISDEIVAEVDLSHESINEMRSFPDVQSIGAAVQNLLLAAVEMGYGTCWLSGMLVARDELEKLLGVEKPWTLVTFIAVGRPDTKPSKRDRKPLQQIFQLIP